MKHCLLCLIYIYLESHGILESHFPGLETNTSNFVKNTLLHVIFSTLFSVFGYPDETLSLVFDILLKLHDFPGLENEILKFHDFPGFP